MDEENSDINKMLVLGETSFRNRNRQFGIKADDRRRHCYIIGKTGVGKTTLIENMVIQDIQNGRGVALVDPHGDPAENVINYIPNNRVNDIVNFDPSDTEFPVAFNVLETVDPSSPGFDQEKSLVSSGLIGVFKKIWADSWGPRLEYILRNTILALLDSPGNTLLGIPRIYVDKKFRKEIVDNIKDPVVRSFWVDEFANYNEKFRSEAIAPIQNKVGQFLSSSIIRNIVGQPKSTIDLQDIMDNRRILIMNLSKGKIGEDNASLLGAMMITKIQLTAMARARIPEADRKDFYLYVDEFQNFATESFATILSEARKYRLNLIIAHQYITQMAEEVRDAVFGNLGTIMSFRVGAFDAEFMEPEFLPTFEQTDLVNLPNYNAYIRLMIDGITSKPFSMRCLRPSGVRYDNREKVLRVSRERFGRPKAVVEEKISRWSGAMAQASEEVVSKEQKSVPAFSPRPAFTPNRTPSAQPVRREETRMPVMARKPVLPHVKELANIVLVPKEPKEVITNLADMLTKKEEPRRLKKVFPSTCDRCGKATELPFEPTPGKDKYCNDCHKIVKAEKLTIGALVSSDGKSPMIEIKKSILPPPPPPPLP
jgi:CxxC-x17-CxxC domain-containing protein